MMMQEECWASLDSSEFYFMSESYDLFIYLDR